MTYTIHVSQPKRPLHIGRPAKALPLPTMTIADRWWLVDTRIREAESMGLHVKVTNKAHEVVYTTK